ncbi:hypothetical protein [Aequorivita marisscotiae]|uniref:Lipocalin-like domain-containing protein n=1 Tax=Aequorivita marisscotiae TaxID=3040348 RepID=A0ABY8KVI4_9FLAO|nr:hypothetical protein [Aequorivita sp. Ant34-E75]WGF92529.1 hypothetical protein QCQ61_15145 [Aequorivita sp. Ant34-E75]
MKQLQKKSSSRLKYCIFLNLLLFLTYNSSCQKNDDSGVRNSLIGSWQLMEIYGSDGSNFPEWYPIENGYIYNFKDNNIITSNKFTCNGVWTFNSSTNINITFDCPEAGSIGDYDVTFEGGNLILTPNPTPCDEGCAEKFKKLTE